MRVVSVCDDYEFNDNYEVIGDAVVIVTIKHVIARANEAMNNSKIMRVFRVWTTRVPQEHS